MPKGVRMRDLTGEPFEHLTARERVSVKTPHGTEIYWICDCICDNQTRTRQDGLLDGRATSCGCRSKDGQTYGESHPLWKGFGDLTGAQFNEYRQKSQQKGLPFQVTIEQVWNNFVQQDRRCRLTNLPLKMKQSRHDHSWSASLDRIDSRRGYTTENIQWLHKVVNIMKKGFDQETFIQMCNLVARQHPREVDPTTIELGRATYCQFTQSRPPKSPE